MRRLPRFLLLVVVSVVAAAGCGGSSDDPEAIVEQWSKAINASDDGAAADLFAADATVIQGGRSVSLATRDDAVAFNAALPCGGKIVESSLEGDEVTATFTLTRRPGHMCDGPGESAVAVFRIADGKITLWQQLPTPGSDGQAA